ncbi:MAG TPA: hypothetical protein VL251_08340 [Thermomonas sp.]|nr:hypothetical protein [Thermomonas sp.]
MDGYRFPFRARSLLALLALAWLASFLHEFSHHAAGALACGAVGRMSLSLFALDAGCGPAWRWSTATGPALSYLLMWLGMALLLGRRHPWWGFALVIANKPLLRLATALAGGGDEGVLWDLWSPRYGRWLASATVLVLCLPPLLACWRTLAPRRRPLVMAGALLLPLLPILPVPFLDRAFYGGWISGAVALPAAFGVPWSVWAVEVAVVALLLLALRWTRSATAR